MMVLLDIGLQPVEVPRLKLLDQLGHMLVELQQGEELEVELQYIVFFLHYCSQCRQDLQEH
jgi:hypothetical protein